MIAVAAVSALHAMWCGFLWVAFGAKHLSQLSKSALARPYTRDAINLAHPPRRSSKQAPDQEAVAAPVLAPWLAIYWALAMSGPFSV